MKDFTPFKEQIHILLEDKETSLDQKLQQICDILQQNIPGYDWVGFYFKNEDKPELKLKCYTGEPTDHTIIPFGKGICGQVALSNENFVVPDVKAQDNYIACNMFVKSEIVIPLFKHEENIGQIDIDSHTPDAFNKADESFLVFINQQITKILEQ